MTQVSFSPSDDVAQLVDSLFAACSPLDRGDTLLHTTISEVLGLAPYQGQWKQCIEKLKRRMEDERGITIWQERGVGYRLLTKKQQMLDVPRHRMRKARRQYSKAKHSIEAVPDQGLSPHQRLIKQRQMEGLQQGLARLTADVRLQATMVRPVERRPRPVAMDVVEA